MMYRMFSMTTRKAKTKQTEVMRAKAFLEGSCWNPRMVT